MARKYYTYEELLTLRLIDLPKVIRDAILKDVEKNLGMMTEKLAKRLDAVPLYQFETWANIYSHISIIA